MRRIFGGNSSSPNPQTNPSSGSSDPSYESPLPAHPSTSRNSPPTPAISDPTTKNSGSRWLGQALGGVTESIRRNGRGHTRNGTDTSATETVSSNASGGGGGTNGMSGSGLNGYGHRNGGSSSRIQEEDVDEIDASSRSYAPNRSSPPSTSLISSTNQEYPRIPTNPYSGANDRNEANSSRAGSNLGEEKDAIMVELLSSQAILESREYQIMSWDEMIQVKKEHTALANKVAALTRSAQLETKLRDTATKLVRLTPPNSSSSSPTNPRATREQAESQLVFANAKVAKVTSELNRVGMKESELRTQLLRHTAGVLALASTRREEETQGIPISPLPTSSSFPSGLSSKTVSRRTSLANSSSTIAAERFEGHHFYAGNKEAIIPTGKPRLFPSSSFTSARLSRSSSGPTFPIPSPTSQQESGKIKELERLVEDLKRRASVQARAESEPRKNVADTSRIRELEEEVESLTRSKSLVEASKSKIRELEEQVESLNRRMSTRTKGDVISSRKNSADSTRIRELEAQVEELKTSISTKALADVGSRKNSRDELKELRVDLDLARETQGKAEEESTSLKKLAEESASKLEEKTKELERNARELERTNRELERIRRESERLKGDHERTRDEHGQTRAELEQMMGDHRDSKSELDNSRKEVVKMRENLENVTVDLEGMKRDLEEARKDLASAHGDLEGAKSRRVRDEEGRLAGSAALSKELSAMKVDLAETREKLSMAKLEWEEAQHRTDLSEKQTLELEEELIAERGRFDKEMRKLQTEVEELESQVRDVDPEAEARLKEELSALTEERQHITESIGDVLRRHRTRPAIGSVLRDLPAFDDTTRQSNLPAYLSSTLDAHFDRVASHVTTLTSDLTSSQAENEETRSGLQMEVKQAVDHRERWRSESETHKRAKEGLEIAHQDLKVKFEDQQTQITSYASLQKSFEEASKEEGELRGQLSSAQSNATRLNAQLASGADQQARTMKVLQELWRAMPPVESRQANSNTNDLNVLRAAFEVAKKPRSSYSQQSGGHSPTGDRFTVESLADRIRILLSEDSKLVQKLVAFQMEQEEHKGNTDRAQKMLAESNTGMQVYQKQIRELEMRMEVSTNQEVTMLERLNELTESLEETRASKRKLEIVVSSTQTQSRALEDELVQLRSGLVASKLEVARLNSRPDDAAKLSKLERELQDLHDQLVDAQEELEDAKKREGRQRTQLLEELSDVQQEVSTLKTKLRQEERKRGK